MRCITLQGILALLAGIAAHSPLGAQAWSYPIELDGLIIDSKPTGPIGTHSFLVGCERTRQAAIFDCGGDAQGMLQAAKDLGLEIKKLLLTHEHWDHSLAMGELHNATGAPIYLHSSGIKGYSGIGKQVLAMTGREMEGTPIMPRHLVEDGDVIDVGDLRFKVLHTPGHAPGHVWYYEEAMGLVMGGDLILGKSVGRTDLEGSNPFHLETSLRKVLRAIPDHVTVFSGHADPATMAEIKKFNVYVRGEAEKIDRARQREL